MVLRLLHSPRLSEGSHVVIHHATWCASRQNAPVESVEGTRRLLPEASDKRLPVQPGADRPAPRFGETVLSHFSSPLSTIPAPGRFLLPVPPENIVSIGIYRGRVIVSFRAACIINNLLKLL